MPQIAGFRGVLPEPSKVKDVVAAFAAKPGGDLAKGLAAGTLVRDASRAVYRYHQAFAEPGSNRIVVRKHLVCAVKLEPWIEGVIRPHEGKVPTDQAAALAQLTTHKAMTPPVLAGFHDAPGEIERAFRRVDGERATLEVTTADRTVHRVWRVQNAELLGQLKRSLAPKKLDVLDGHDRYEAALAYRDQLAGKRPLAQYASANFVVMCLVDLGDPNLAAAPRLPAGLIAMVLDPDEDLV
ncbi:MAG TPA: DUF1015 family protein [Kofleriaceae bacterium]|nr:DUF1015 family protein [Kofleriaceae bacterium]